MISNDYHLRSAKAELATWRTRLVEMEATFPRVVSTPAAFYRPATIRQRIRELEAEIAQYRMATRAPAVTSACGGVALPALPGGA